MFHITEQTEQVITEKISVNHGFVPNDEMRNLDSLYNLKNIPVSTQNA